MMGEPHEEERPRSWEVYSAMPGIDSLYSGASKRTPWLPVDRTTPCPALACMIGTLTYLVRAFRCGGFFTS